MTSDAEPNCTPRCSRLVAVRRRPGPTATWITTVSGGDGRVITMRSFVSESAALGFAAEALFTRVLPPSGSMEPEEQNESHGARRPTASDSDAAGERFLTGSGSLRSLSDE